MTSPSKGHVGYVDSYEYGFSGLELFHGPDGTLYRAPRANPLDIYGYRQGARFACAPRADGHQEFIEVTFNVSH